VISSEQLRTVDVYSVTGERKRSSHSLRKYGCDCVVIALELEIELVLRIEVGIALTFEFEFTKFGVGLHWPLAFVLYISKRD
jgi:hypothetical protein